LLPVISILPSHLETRESVTRMFRGSSIALRVENSMGQTLDLLFKLSSEVG
jgi:hypothetical protein